MSNPPAPRSGPVLLFFLGIAGLTLAAGFLFMWRDTAPRGASRPLLVYCAAGLRAPLEIVARDYEKETGQRVELSFGGSHTLLANIELSKTGDLYIPGDDSYVRLARQRNLVAETIPVAHMTALAVVKKGNPKAIRSLDDLARTDVTIAQANPDATAIGKIVREVLQRSNRWEAISQRTAVFKGTVNDAANDVKLGAADVAFAWDALAMQYPDLEFVAIPDLANARSDVMASVLKSSAQPTSALRFARFLTARDKGLKRFEMDGFKVAAGDVWSPQPELNLFAGAMLRPAIEETITAFERREGARVNRIYNGCGILVAEMRTGKTPDAYFACDTSFMDQVSDLFIDPETVSSNQLVILVHKGNPFQVKALRDLGKAGLRLGVGHEKQCALGVLTRNTLLTNGTYGTVMRNVTVQSPTGDFLVNQLRTKSLDAVIAYLSNATGFGDELEAIAIDIPCAVAGQPVAPARDTKYPQLAARLIDALTSAASKDRFEANGFRVAHR